MILHHRYSIRFHACCRLYVPLFLLFNLYLPTYIPIWLWGERLAVSLALNLARYMITLHGTWTVNSVAHMYGSKPYDKDIYATECIVVSYPLMFFWVNSIIPTP